MLPRVYLDYKSMVAHDFIVKNKKNMFKYNLFLKTEHNFNSQDRQCPKCHKVVNVDDKFCINCGHSLQQTLSNSNDNIASHTYSNTKPEIENETGGPRHG